MPDNNNKTIKFKFELDNQSFTTVQNAVRSLTEDFKKLGSAMGTGSIGAAFPGFSVGGTAPTKSTQVARANQRAQQTGGGGGQQQTMGKVILDNAQAFKRFAAEGKDASKIMTDALKRDISVQERALEGLNQKLSQLDKGYQMAARRQKEFLAAGNQAGADAFGRVMADRQRDIAATSGDILKSSGQLNQMKGLTGDISMQSIKSAIGYTGTGFGSGMQTLGSIGKIIGGIATAAVVGVQESMAGSRMYMQQEAARGQFVHADIAAARRGDISNLQARRAILQDSDKARDFRTQLGTGSRAETWIEGIGTTLGQALSRVTGGLSSKILGGGGDGALGSALTDTSRNQALAQKQRDMIEQQKRTEDFQELQYATNYFTQNLGSRMQAARSGIGRMGRNKQGKFVDPWGDLDIKLTEQGYDINQFMGTRVGLRSIGGNDFANKFAYNQMAAANVGYGGYAEAMKALVMSAGGDMKMGAGLMDFALGQGVIGGQSVGRKLDTNAALSLATVLGGYDPGQGAINGGSLMASYMLGMNTDPNASALKQMMQTQAFKGGVDLLNQYSTGALDPYQVGKNTVMAANTLGAGADTYAVDYLAGMNVKKLVNTMMTGEVDETARNLGLGQGDIAKYGENMFSTLLENYHGKSGPAGDAAARFKSSGKSLREYLSTADETEIGALATALNVGSFKGQQQDTALAALKTLKGSALYQGEGDVTPGSLNIGALDPETKAFQKNLADFKRKDQQRLKEEAESGRLKEDFSNLKRESEVLANFGKNLAQGVEDFSAALDALAKKMNRVSGYVPPPRGQPK